MLLGENLRGGHQRALVAIRQRVHQGHRRDGRLARADFALKQTRHRSTQGRVVQDFVGHPQLGAGEPERQPAFERSKCVSLSWQCDGGIFLPGQAAFEHQ